MKVATGKGEMVIEDKEETEAHPPLAEIVLVTEYVPGVLAAKLTSPVEELMLNPVVDVNVPATPPPINAGDGLLPF